MATWCVDLYSISIETFIERDPLTHQALIVQKGLILLGFQRLRHQLGQLELREFHLSFILLNACHAFICERIFVDTPSIVEWVTTFTSASIILNMVHIIRVVGQAKAHTVSLFLRHSCHLLQICLIYDTFCE